MSMTSLLGTIAFNDRGNLFFGQDSTAIMLEFADVTVGVISLGFQWRLYYRTAGGEWEKFHETPPVSPGSPRQAFIDAVNSIGVDAYLNALAAYINQKIQDKFAEYVGAGVPLPARPAPGPVTDANIVSKVSDTMVNDFKFANVGSVPAMVRKT